MEKDIKKVTDYLDKNAIGYQIIRHEAVVSCQESREVIDTPDYCACKNLFLIDSKSKNYYLVVLKSIKQANLKQIAGSIGAGRFEFVDDQTLMKVLGVIRGAVSPMALIDDKYRIRVVIDKDVLNAEKVRFHPMDNTATLLFEMTEFLKYMDSIKKYIIKLQTE